MLSLSQLVTHKGIHLPVKEGESTTRTQLLSPSFHFLRPKIVLVTTPCTEYTLAARLLLSVMPYSHSSTAAYPCQPVACLLTFCTILWISAPPSLPRPFSLPHTPPSQVDVYEYFNRSSSRISDTFFTDIREGLARVSAHIRAGGCIDTFDMDSPFTDVTHVGSASTAAAGGTTAGAGAGLVSARSLPLSGLTPNLSSLGADAAERRSDGSLVRSKSPFKGSMQGA